MTNLEKFNKKWKSSIGEGAYSWSNESITAMLLDLSASINKDLKLINKPVETTNEQPLEKCVCGQRLQIHCYPESCYKYQVGG